VFVYDDVNSNFISIRHLFEPNLNISCTRRHGWSSKKPASCKKGLRKNCSVFFSFGY